MGQRTSFRSCADAHAKLSRKSHESLFMDRKPRNLGRAYLIVQLQQLGLSRRQAKRILNFIFAEMKAALARNEAVEFPFGWLQRSYKISPHWEVIGDEPMQPYTVEHFMDADGVELLGGLDSMEFGLWSWSCFMPKTETPPYIKPRRPRGRPRKRPSSETAPQGAAAASAKPKP